MSDNGWDEYSKLVLSELERLSTAVNILSACVNNLKLDINTIKTENKDKDRMYNALFGTGGGAIGGCAILIARHFGLF